MKFDRLIGPMIGAVIGAGGVTAYDAAVTDTLDTEGGYVNHEDDLGQATNHGVTVQTMGRCGYTGPPEDYTEAMARECYKSEFWTAKMSTMSDLPGYYQVAATLFDMSVNTGPGNGAKFLQRCLEIETDGVIGQGTMAALLDYAGAVGPVGGGILRQCLIDEALRHYVRISEVRTSNESFTYGWLNHRVAIDNKPTLRSVQRCLNVMNSKGKHYPDIAVDGKWGSATLSAIEAFLDRRKMDGLDALMECSERLE